MDKRNQGQKAVCAKFEFMVLLLMLYAPSLFSNVGDAPHGDSLLIIADSFALSIDFYYSLLVVI
jgi:hypothetical protein